jgi:hypothetical protein
VPASRSKQAEVAARQARAMELRVLGFSGAFIKAELGYSSEGAARMDISRGFRKLEAARVAEGAAVPLGLALERLDQAERTVQAVRMVGQGSTEYAYQVLALAAVDRQLRIHDRRVRLLAIQAAAARLPAAGGEDEIAAQRRKRRNRFSAAGGGL